MYSRLIRLESHSFNITIMDFLQRMWSFSDHVKNFQIGR